MRGLLVVNPHATTTSPRVVDVIVHAFSDQLELDVTVTTHKGHGEALGARAREEGADVVVTLGGDGVVHEVVNGMLDGGVPIVPDAVLGVVAAGSGCDLVRTFGLPGDASRACLHLQGDNTYPLDLGRIRCEGPDGPVDRIFVNVAEAGLGGAVADRAARLPRRLGQARYFVGFWLTLPGYRLAEVRVTAGRQTYEGPAYAIIIGNAQFYGGGMKISPRSYPGDGVLDVLVFTGPKTDAFTLLPRIYRGDHVPHDHVVELRSRDRITIEADRPIEIEADGEPVGRTPATIDVIPHPIRMKL